MRQKNCLNTEEKHIVCQNVNEILCLYLWYCMEEETQIEKHANTT